jgi:hypothetical protein
LNTVRLYELSAYSYDWRTFWYRYHPVKTFTTALPILGMHCRFSFIAGYNYGAMKSAGVKRAREISGASAISSTTLVFNIL